MKAVFSKSCVFPHLYDVGALERFASFLRDVAYQTFFPQRRTGSIFRNFHSTRFHGDGRFPKMLLFLHFHRNEVWQKSCVCSIPTKMESEDFTGRCIFTRFYGDRIGSLTKSCHFPVFLPAICLFSGSEQRCTTRHPRRKKKIFPLNLRMLSWKRRCTVHRSLGNNHVFDLG